MSRAEAGERVLAGYLIANMTVRNAKAHDRYKQRAQIVLSAVVGDIVVCQGQQALARPDSDKRNSAANLGRYVIAPLANFATAKEFSQSTGDQELESMRENSADTAVTAP